ncbi:DUF4097 family beta strand repeat-containing protein [Anaerocolumna sp. AGMB13025]|uniref:DUF4097 family beta strand repeat-containing protein n=1 Tax=Anaerocolumna sp. AGMB13025 TaxID=3039116 RepID=UPI0024202BC3|nr:DUF4097 family beta strand repeat-containing protein [Anaerocolumna sp. AGMB13025]WFR58534.1 DUF4097 family beta strand repeat-containing protein [Anaerocolumna sp. AGMB13025]
MESKFYDKQLKDYTVKVTKSKNIEAKRRSKKGIRIDRFMKGMLSMVFAVMVLSGCSYSFSFNNSNQLKMEDAKEFKMEKTLADPIKQITIDSRIGDIEIIKDDNYYVEINYRYFNEKPTYKLENGILSFDDSKAFPNSYSISFDIKNTIKIYLPEDADLGQITISTASGDVSLSDLQTEKLKVSVAYGDLTLKKAAAEETNINMSSGSSNISDLDTKTLDYSNSYGNGDFTNINKANTNSQDDSRIKISMSSGNADFDTVNSKNLEISNSYGNITGKGLLINGFEADLSSGDLKISKSILEKADISNSYGDVILSLTGDTKDYMLDLSTSYGKVDVDGKNYDGHLIRENGGSKRLTADLSSGDIEVTFE